MHILIHFIFTHMHAHFYFLIFSFRLFEFIPLECPVGYRGRECIFRCEPPTYGPTCNKTCDCTKDQCDYQFGCKLSSNSGIITLPYVYDSRTNVKYDIYSILFLHIFSSLCEHISIMFCYWLFYKHLSGSEDHRKQRFL